MLNSSIYYLFDFILFIIINIANLAVFMLFISRVKMIKHAKKFGIAFISIGIPTLIVAIINLLSGREWWLWFYPFLFIAFIIFVLIVDFIKKIEFRKPRNYRILIPLLILYYVSIILMWGITWSLGLIYGAITGITYFLQLGGAIYAGKHGVG